MSPITDDRECDDSSVEEDRDSVAFFDISDDEDYLPKCFEDGLIGGTYGGFGGGGSNAYNGGGGGYTGGNGSSSYDVSGGGGGSYSVDPNAKRSLGWFEAGKVKIKLITK